MKELRDLKDSMIHTAVRCSLREVRFGGDDGELRPWGSEIRVQRSRFADKAFGGSVWGSGCRV